jgi:stringent starvation protein B
LNKFSLIVLMSLATAGAYAQGAGSGITMSTDPAKAAAVEKHAQELQARQSKEAASKPAATHTSAKNTKSTKKTKGKTPATHKSATPKPTKAPKG